MNNVPILFALSGLNLLVYFTSEHEHIKPFNLFISGMTFGAAIIRLGLTMGWYKL